MDRKRKKTGFGGKGNDAVLALALLPVGIQKTIAAVQDEDERAKQVWIYLNGLFSVLPEDKKMEVLAEKNEIARAKLMLAMTAHWGKGGNDDMLN